LRSLLDVVIFFLDLAESEGSDSVAFTSDS